MIEEFNNALKQINRKINTKNDAFLVLCSLNLLNALIKKEEYKKIISYGQIKPTVSRFIQFCMNSDEDLIDEIYYHPRQKCVYIRCYNIQFSFHNINTNIISEDIINYITNENAKWDGIRLQPISLELFNLAIDVIQEKTLNELDIKEQFDIILNSSRIAEVSKY